MSNTNKIPALFWVVSAISLIWYLFGAVQFVGSMIVTADMLKPAVDSGQMTQAYADLLLSTPLWLQIAFGVATLAGVIGSSLCLLLRKRFAMYFFMLSLLAALIMYVYMFVISGKANVYPAFDFGIAAAVVIITSFMIWFCKKQDYLN